MFLDLPIGNVSGAQHLYRVYNGDRALGILCDPIWPYPRKFSVFVFLCVFSVRLDRSMLPNPSWGPIGCEWVLVPFVISVAKPRLVL